MERRRSISSALALAVGIGSWIVALPAVMADEPAQQPAPTVQAQQSPAAIQTQQPAETVQVEQSNLARQPAVRTKATGSNILRVRPDRTLPLLVLDRDYIDQSAATNATELIRSVPQAQNFGGFVPASH
jgi:hypothetical protein